MTHSLADWLAVVSFGIGTYAALCVPYFLAVDADPGYFDPRPAMSRAVESGRLDLALIAVANTKYDARVFVADARQLAALNVRDAAITAAALLALLSPVAGGTR